jgi:hypothetical protein
LDFDGLSCGTKYFCFLRSGNSNIVHFLKTDFSEWNHTLNFLEVQVPYPTYQLAETMLSEAQMNSIIVQNLNATVAPEEYTNIIPTSVFGNSS